MLRQTSAALRVVSGAVLCCHLMGMVSKAMNLTAIWTSMWSFTQSLGCLHRARLYKVL